MVSVYPCAIHGKRINGALEAIRINIWGSQGKYTRYMRVCPVDLSELIRATADEWVPVDDNELAIDEELCATCGETSRGTGDRCFLSAYVFRSGQSRQDYFAIYCDRCARGLVNTYGLVEELKP